MGWKYVTGTIKLVSIFFSIRYDTLQRSGVRVLKAAKFHQVFPN